MNDHYCVTIKHPNGLRRIRFPVTSETTSDDCVRTLILDRFMPRMSSRRCYVLVRANGRPYRPTETLDTARTGRHEVLSVMAEDPLTGRR